jgi:hypothetical protein
MFTKLRKTLSPLWPRTIKQTLKTLEAWPAFYTKVVLRRRFQPVPRGDRPTVLFASCKPGFAAHRHWISNVESLIAKRLELNGGMHPAFLFYDPLYERLNPYRGFGFDDFWFWERRPDAYAGDLDIRAAWAIVDRRNVGEIDRFWLHDVPVGRLALASARLRVKKSRLETDADWAVLRCYMAEAIEGISVLSRVLDSVRPAAVVANHSTYVSKGGLMFHLALLRGIRVIAWQARTNDSIVARAYTPPERMEHVSGISAAHWLALRSADDADRARNIALAKNYITHQINEGGEHLRGQPLLGLQNQPQGADFKAFVDDKPIVGVFTHLTWDASGSFYEDLFPSLRDWAEFTVRLALENDQVNWVFRVHPVEAVTYTAEQTDRIIRDLLPSDVQHIRLIEAHEPVSSYAIAPKLKVAVTVRGTLAAELPCLGVPVVCAGTGQTSVADFNIFPQSLEEYAALLTHPERIAQPTPKQIEDALLFAYAFFVDKKIKFNCVDDLSSLQMMRQITPKDIIGDSGLGRFAEMITGSVTY